jgi:hypothetical protein
VGDAAVSEDTVDAEDGEDASDGVSSLPQEISNAVTKATARPTDTENSFEKCIPSHIRFHLLLNRGNKRTSSAGNEIRLQDPSHPSRRFAN